MFGWRRVDLDRSVELAPLGEVATTWPGAGRVPEGAIQLTDPRVGARQFRYEELAGGSIDDAIQRDFGDAVLQELLEEIRRRRSVA